MADRLAGPAGRGYDVDDEERYGSQLGARLRDVRTQQGLSLQDVEARSDGELKASVVGAYERGERSVSMPRLRKLADFYGVPVGHLLRFRSSRPRNSLEEPGGLCIDLTKLPTGSEGELVKRYLGSIQALRGDYNGRILTVRETDVQALSVFLELSPDELREHLVADGAEAA